MIAKRWATAKVQEVSSPISAPTQLLGPQLIAVAGVSGAGKTWLLESIRIPYLDLDRFYLDLDDASQRTGTTSPDWNSIATYDLPAATSAVRQIAQGSATEIPVYSYALDKRVGTSVFMSNARNLWIGRVGRTFPVIL